MSNTQSNLHSSSRDAELLRTLALALGQPVVIAGMTLSGPRYHHDHPTALSLATLNADTLNLQHWSSTDDIAPLTRPDHPINRLW